MLHSLYKYVLECQTADWPNHRAPCKESRRQVLIGDDGDGDGDAQAVFAIGSRLQQVVGGAPTGVICQVTQYQEASKCYVLQDLKVAPTIGPIPAELVGPTAWLDSSGHMQQSLPNHEYKILQGAELQEQGFLGRHGNNRCELFWYDPSVSFSLWHGSIQQR